MPDETQIPTFAFPGPPDTPTDVPLPEAIGDFKILSVLGRGGMGIVYEAEQKNPRRRVALKVVARGTRLDELRLRLFRREAETLARLVHPNIAALYEAGRTPDGQHFLTMELVAGQPLGDYVREHMGGDRPTQAQLHDRLRLFETICRAVSYAHQRGVIHRDLKPSNVLVIPPAEPASGASGAHRQSHPHSSPSSVSQRLPQVKILDFGLARIVETEGAPAAGQPQAQQTVMTELGDIRGTLPYMSPEQARADSREVDSRSDVYALGVLLYEMLTGRLPIDTQTGSLVSALKAICDEPPRPLKLSFAGGFRLDPDIQTIVGKALEKDPDHRYASADALAEDVQRYLADQPILAHPPSTMYQLKKLVARHKLSFAAAGGIALLLVALAVTLVVQGERVRRERDRAEIEAAKASAINGFLKDALGAADPWSASKGSRNVTLLDALRQAQAKAHAAFLHQPLVEAAVLQTIGQTFANLAEFTEAEKALRRALDLRESAAGKRSSEAAETWITLAKMYLVQGEFDKAYAAANEALEIMKSLHASDPNSLEVADAMNSASDAARLKGKFPEARKLGEEALRIARLHVSEASKPTLGAAMRVRAQAADALDPRRVEMDSLRVLGGTALDQDDYKRYEEMSRERLATARALHPDRHMEIAEALGDYAVALTQVEKYPEAERAFLETLDIELELLGEDHPEVATTRENLGNVYFREKKLDLTAKNLEVVLAMRRKALGDDSEPVARTLANMATVYMMSGNLEAAGRTYPEAVERLSRKLGPDHPDVSHVLTAWGECLTKQKKYAEAEPVLLRALGLRVKAFGEKHTRTQRTIKDLGDLYEQWGKPAQSQAYRARLVPAETTAGAGK